MSSTGSRACSFLLIAISLVLVSCAPTRVSQTPPRAVPAPPVAAKVKAAAPVSQPAAQAVAAPLSKPVFVEFYSTICDACKQIKPAIYTLQDEYKNLVEFKSYDAAGIDKETRDRYKFVGYPQIVMLDAHGQIIFNRLGFQTYDSLKSDLVAVLKVDE